MKIRKAKPAECGPVSSLMERLIDEIYAQEEEKVRRILKANFTRQALKELCRDKQSLLYVVEIDGRIAAFLFGWLFHNVFTIYWIYCKKAYRGKGIVKDLLAPIEKKLIAKGCYKVEMYVYAEHNRFLNFCSKLGFKKGALIQKSMFGFRIRNIYKHIGKCAKLSVATVIMHPSLGFLKSLILRKSFIAPLISFIGIK